MRPIAAVVLVALLPSLAQADVVNGDFELGATGWLIDNPQNWITEFPTDGGNPTRYGRVRSPALNSGGIGMLGQQFFCGQADDSTGCRITFDYKIDFLDALTGSARIQVQVGDEILYTGPSATTGGILWRNVEIPLPTCGLKTLYLILQVDDGNNAWWACFDNVAGDCQAVPVEPITWGLIKSRHGL